MNRPRSGPRAARPAVAAPTPPLVHPRHTAGGRILRAATRGLPVFAVALILAMLLLPAGLVGAQDAPADDQGPDVVATVVADGDGQVSDDPVAEDPTAEDPVVDAEGLPTGDPDAMPDAAPDVNPDAADPDPALVPGYESGIYVTMFTCPGPIDGGLDLLLQFCPASVDTDFDIYGPNLTLNSRGGIALNALPAGDYRIRAYFPAGFRTPTAFCGLGPADQPPGPLSPVVVIEGYYEFSLPQGQALFCDWFNVPAASQTSGEILVNKHFCPTSSAFDAYSATIYDLAANCQEPAEPVPFSVLKDGSAIASGVAQGAPNYLALEGLPTGPVSVVEAMPEGYGDPRVFCSVSDELGNDRAPLAEAPVDNDRIYWTLNDGDVVFCDWFNVPAPLGVTISVVKYVCPSYIRKDLVVYEAYASVCTSTATNVAFKLDGASTGNPGEQLTDVNGQVTWSGLEADHYYLTEEVPAGFGRPAVFCGYSDPAAFQTFEYQRYPVSAENRIEFDVTDGQNITCSWYNIPSR